MSRASLTLLSLGHAYRVDVPGHPNPQLGTCMTPHCCRVDVPGLPNPALPHAQLGTCMTPHRCRVDVPGLPNPALPCPALCLVGDMHDSPLPIGWMSRASLTLPCPIGTCMTPHRCRMDVPGLPNPTPCSVGDMHDSPPL